MNNGVRVRRSRESDLRALEWDGMFTHHREILERTYREQLDGDQVMLLAEVEGEPRGQSWIDVRTARHRATGIIWALRVHPDAQRRGLGRLLLNASEEVIRQQGLEAAELVTERDNTVAQQLYRSNGYEIVRPVTQTYSYTTPDGRFCEHVLDLVEMRKELR